MPSKSSTTRLLSTAASSLSSLSSRSTCRSLPRLCKGQDVMKLDVEPVLGQLSRLRDPVLLLEGEEQRVAEVLDRVQLIEAEEERRGLLAGGEEEFSFDVVRAAELVAFPQGELPVLARRDPLLDRGGMSADGFVDLDLERGVRPLRGGGPRLYLESWHARPVPGPEWRQT